VPILCTVMSVDAHEKETNVDVILTPETAVIHEYVFIQFFSIRQRVKSGKWGCKLEILKKKAQKCFKIRVILKLVQKIREIF
jgi:hypothetical protein